MSDDVETRDPVPVTLDLREVSAAGRPYRYLEGRAVPYMVWADINGWLVERHAVGSFKRSTNGRSGAKLPLMLFHDNQRFPIGHAESWKHTDDGMFGIWKLNDTADAQQAAALAENGDLVGLSIGFQDVSEPDRDERDGKLWVTRNESRLVEVSMTPTPAFADAEVTRVRTRMRPPTPPERDVDRWRRTLEALRSGH